MQTVREVMTNEPKTCPMNSTIEQAARTMRDSNIGSLIAVENGDVKGIVTDRDIVVRAIADGGNPDEVLVADVCSGALTTINADASVDDALALATSHQVRRLPVLEDGHPIGLFSLRDLESMKTT